MIWFKHPNDLPNDKRLAALDQIMKDCRGLWYVSATIIEELSICAQNRDSETQFQSTEYYFKKRVLQKIHGENHLGIQTFHYPRRRIRIRHQLQLYGKRKSFAKLI